jgi:DNA-directed RNA polymerase subunit RPC12/RpoP
LFGRKKVDPMKKCLKCGKDVEDLRHTCPHCGGEKLIASSNDNVENYEALCNCGATLPFDRGTRELRCPGCEAKIAIRYVGHHDPTRSIVENAGWELMKGIFSYGIINWTARLQEKRFEDFQKFAGEVYSNHLCSKAKALDANKRVHFVYFYEDHIRMELGPYDLTINRGFAEYLFNCVTLQTHDFVFTPIPPDRAGFGDYDCPAVFEIAINNSTTHYVLHFVTKLTPWNKSGSVTMLSPSTIHLGFFVRMEVTEASDKTTQWQLVDGQLGPIAFKQTPFHVVKEETLAKIRAELGDEVASMLNVLVAAKRKFGPRNSFYYCSQTEIESELQVLGLWGYRDRLFEILKKDSGCFVVTACMGDENHPYVVILRQFRDQVLSTSPLGKQFIKLYALVGPYVANLIGRSNTLRKVMTFLVITPAVSVLLRWFLLCWHHRCNHVGFPGRQRR